MEFKEGTYTARAIAGTRRRAYTRTPYRNLSTRVNRMVKLNKLQNPLHMVGFSAVAAFGTASTTTAVFNLCDSIQEGDQYNNRFGTIVRAKRFRCNIVVLPTATSPNCYIRFVLFRAQQGSTLATTVVDTVATSATIANNNITRVFCDDMYLIPAATNNPGVVIRKSMKLNHVQRFNQSGATSTTGDSLFLAIISNLVTGATAPNVGGWFELWFSP